MRTHLTPSPRAVRLSLNQLARINDQRVQDEARIAGEIQRQHPDVRRGDALRTATEIVRRNDQTRW